MHRHTDRQGISARNAQTTTDREQDKVEMLTLQIKLVKYIPRGWLADFFGHLSCSSLSSRIFFSATIFARKKVERGFAIVPMATTQWKIKQKKNNHKRLLDRHICPLERPSDGPSSPRSLGRHVSLQAGWQTVLRLREMRLSSYLFVSSALRKQAKNLWFGKLNFSVEAHWCLVMKLGITVCFRFTGDTF